MMTVAATISLLVRWEPTLGEFQCLLAFRDGSMRALFQHGSRNFANFQEFDAWLDQVCARPSSQPSVVNPS